MANQVANSVELVQPALPSIDLTALPSKRFERAIEINENDFFVLGKRMKILSGAIHYFRIPPAYWRDRLLKLKAMGLNTVET